MITVRWNYTHTGGLDLTRVVITATRGVETTQLDVPYGNLTDLSRRPLMRWVVALQYVTPCSGMEEFFYQLAAREDYFALPRLYICTSALITCAIITSRTLLARDLI